ncbi:MAG: flagellar biosynthetic protein FliO [Sedimentisphaerales bacterium]
MSLNDSPRIVFDVSLSVAGFKKKIFVFLITVALGGGVLVICSAQSATNGMESEESKIEPEQPESGAESENSPLFANDQDFFGKSEYNPVGGEFSVRAVLAVLFVLALFIAAIYVSKKLLPKITNLPGKEIRIVETVHLGPRKAVHLLEIGNRRFLIGSTNENVTKLADMGSDLMDLSAKETNYN